jgi:predicted  nucleic acid-binding Zn-ribbon protein
MKELTVEQLQDKIKKIEEDLKSVNNEKGREALSSYIDFLRDELKAAEIKVNGKLQS